MQSKRQARIPWVLIILAIAVCLKAVLLIWNVVPFNSDEAVVGLMAKHIIAGERPIFFYGQAYMGSLDAFLVAGSFMIFGQRVIAIRIVQIALYLLTIISTLWIAKVGFSSRRIGIMAAVLLVVPTVNFALYTTASLGGYGEALLFGNLIILVGLCIWQKIGDLNDSGATGANSYPWLMVLWGFIIGAGFWANALTLVYSLPIGLIIGWRIIFSKYITKTKIWAFLSIFAGFLVGSLPWWIFIFQNGVNKAIPELFGSAIQYNNGIFSSVLLNHLVNFLLLGLPVIFGFRPPWEIWWLVLPLLPFCFIIWGWVFVNWGKSLFTIKTRNFLHIAFAGIILTIVLGFVLSPFGNDPSGRYFLPFSVIFSLIAAEVIVSKIKTLRWQAALIGFIALYQLGGVIQCAAQMPPGITTQFYDLTAIDHRYDNQLINFLKINGEKYGYTNYWVSYPLAFESNEALIYIPRLPYHLDLIYTSRDNRYNPYTELVKNSNKVAYIVTNNPPLLEHLRAGFKTRNISWTEEKIGDYLIFYKLSGLVRPEDLGM